MDTQILMAYATKHGSTAEVAEHVAGTLRRKGLEVDVRPAADVRALDGYHGVVLGGALYMGRWHKDAVAFLNRLELEGRPLAVFAMGPRDLSDGEVGGSRAQLDRALAKAHGVEPSSVAIFGGVLDPAQHRFPFNRLDPFDARDWGAIEAWADEIAPLFGYGKTASEARDPRRELQQTPR